METKIALSLSLALITGSLAHADSTQEILESSVVKTTFSLMQAKHSGACKELSTESVHWMCTGLLPPVDRLQIFTTGCAFALEIKCPTESASIFGQKRSAFAIDASGVRTDIDTVDLGISFGSIEISQKP